MYELLNKDSLIVVFDTELREVYGTLPLDFINIFDWLQTRTTFTCARNVKEFLKSIGISGLSDMIYVTHCVSLRDTFWVRAEGQNLTWSNVNPFTNDYSRVISQYALDGVSKCRSRNYFSPDISTYGSFPHTWKRRNRELYFIKGSSKYTIGGSNSGREPISEYYACQIAKFLGIDCVDYTLREHKRVDGRIDLVTECKCYTSEQRGAVSASALGLNTYEKVLSYRKNVADMLFLDCLLLNTDRHFGNIEFFVDNNTLRVGNLVPVFDNNYSFLPRFLEGYDTFNRSDYMARDGRSFEDLYGLILRYKSFESYLLRLRKFKFRRKKGVTETRLKFMKDFLNMQIKYLLRLT